MNRRALVIDDSLTVRMHLRDVFADHGYEVATCDAIACARKEIGRAVPDVVILDVHLPDGDGIEFLRELRSAPQAANVGVILLSARTDVEQRLRGISIGADEYIGKPYNVDLLLERADALSERKREASVLVIDDSLSYREHLRELVSSAGYSVITAETGEQGLHLASVHRPRAIIVDYMLPGIQGDTVIRRIRQIGHLRRTPTLLLTASENPADQVRALDSGADTFVRKDQDPAVLLACLNSIVRSTSTPSAVEEVNATRDKVLFVGEQKIAEGLRANLASPDLTFTVTEAKQLSGVSLEAVDCMVLQTTAFPSQTIKSDIHSLKSRIERGGMRVIVVGHTDEREMMVTCMNAGADDFVEASEGVAIIAARVRAHLRRKKLEDENSSLREQLLRNRMAAEMQKEVAQATALRNQELQQLAETIPALVWTAAPDGTLTYTNSRWQEYTGVAPEQVLGEGWFDLLHPEDREVTASAFRQSIRLGRPFQAEYRVRSAAGTFRWFLGRGLPVRTNGLINRWFGTAIDVQERHEMEEALRRSEKIAATGRLAASIAHEINNPLESIVNVLYLLPVLMKEDVDKALTYIKIAQQEVARVSHITRQTLAFYRDTGKAAKIDLCALAREILRVYESKASEAGVRLRPQLECTRTIEGFTGEVRQVISNLVANAIEASAPKTTVTVRVRPWWNLRNGRTGVRVTVCDEGKGIPSEFLPQLYTPFATTKGHKGTGLGLWVSQSIVEKHAGKISVRSSTRPGRSGTIFSVFFPSAPHHQSRREDEFRELFGNVGRELLDSAG